jgi:hypothetical protein
VYRIALQTQAGQEEFALKYTCPVETDEAFYHTSGVVAMRVMQLAQQEQPVLGITYVVPVLATHDVTVSPFIFDGVTTSDVTLKLHYPKGITASKLQDEHGFNSTNAGLLFDILQGEQGVSGEQSFFHAYAKVLDDQTEVLKSWVRGKINTTPEFARFSYNDSDTHLSQSVMSIPLFHEAYEQFRNDGRNGLSPAFTQNILRSLGLIELGVGMRQKSSLK